MLKIAAVVALVLAGCGGAEPSSQTQAAATVPASPSWSVNAAGGVECPGANIVTTDFPGLGTQVQCMWSCADYTTISKGGIPLAPTTCRRGAATIVIWKTPTTGWELYADRCEEPGSCG